MNDLDLQFNSVTVSRAQLVAAVRRYEGLEYSPDVTQVRVLASGEVSGCANCFGVLLLAARDLGMLAPDFDVNVAPGAGGVRRARILRRLLELNFDLVPRESLRSADVLLCLHRDVDPRLNEAHHVAMCVSSEPAPRGSMFHALNNGGGVVGKTFVQRIDALTWERIAEVHRLKGIVD